MRLNGWQRIGIVLSVIWFICGGLWGNSMGIHEGDWVSRQYQFCLEHDAEPHMPSTAQCQARFDKDWPDAIKYHWWEGLIVATVPIPLGWLLAYGIIALSRWIWRGGFRME